MRKIPPYIALLSLIFTSGCFYAPDEEVFTEVTSPNPVGMISLSDYNDGDTIVLFNAADFKFDVGIDKGSIKEVKVLFRGAELYKGTARSGVFAIKEANLRTGIYYLQIEFISSSESGSLLDKLGGELFKVWRKWVVKIDVDPPSALVEVPSNTDFLTFKWEPYLKPNFVSYEFAAYPSGTRRVISDPHVASWVDSTFVCGQARFILTVKNLLHSRTTEKLVIYPQGMQLAYRADDSTALLSWRKIHFPAAFKGVEFLENENSRVTITSAVDTTLQLKLKDVIMGRRSTIDFQVSSRYKDFPVFFDRYHLENPLGLEQLQNPTTMYYSLGLNSFIGHDHSDNQLNVYDADLNITAVDASIPGPVNIPSLGPYIYFRTSMEIVQRDFFTKTQTAIAVTKSNGAPADISAISGGANGNVIFTYLDDVYWYAPEYHTKVYNMNPVRLIHSITSDYYSDPSYYPAPNMSGDGRFFYLNNDQHIYTIEGDNLRDIGVIPFAGSFAGFREDNNEQMFLSKASSILLCSTWDFSVLKTMPKPESGYALKNYDPVTKNILLTKPSALKAYLINVDTDEVKTLPVYGDQYKFLNGILFDEQGYYYLRVF